MPLTDAAIRNAKPTDKPYRLYDAEGLYLEVAPSGGKWWRLKYRFGGKEKLLSMGVYPAVGLREARTGRAGTKEMIKAGIDPSLARKQAKQKVKQVQEQAQQEEKTDIASRFENVAREWAKTKAPKWTPRYAVYIMRRLEADIFPHIGNRSVYEITSKELLTVLQKIEERGTKDLPNRQRAVVSQIFEFANLTIERFDRNPAEKLQGALKSHVVKHQSALEIDELPELLRKIEEYDSLAGGDLQTKLALKLMALTFVRTSELREASWAELDLDKAEWRIPAERMKMKAPHFVPLAKQAVTILRTLQTINGSYHFVFAGRVPQRPMSQNTILFALYRMGYRGRMTGHGFRAVASTYLNEQGWNPDAIERQLAHNEQNETRAAYHRSQYLDERRTMMQSWADYLDKVRQEDGKLFIV